MNFRKCDKKIEVLECSLCESENLHIIKNNETNSINIICGHCGDDSIVFGAGITIKEAIFIINNSEKNHI